MTPHVDWRGAYALGTWDDGSSNPCTDGPTPKCSYIAWPALGMSVARGRPLDVTLPSGYWMGSLLSEATDGSGLQYKRNRYYDPASGRFTQVDPIGLAGGLNAYGFGGGGQVNYSDPFGLAPWPDDITVNALVFIAQMASAHPAIVRAIDHDLSSVPKAYESVAHVIHDLGGREEALEHTSKQAVKVIIQNDKVQPVWTGARRTSTKAVPALLGDAAESVAPKIALRAFSILGFFLPTATGDPEATDAWKQYQKARMQAHPPK